MNITLSSFKGINNIASEYSLPDGYLRECVDFDINDGGKLYQRDGYFLQNNAVFICIGGDDKRCFAVKDGDLVELIVSGAGFTFTTIKSSIGAVSLDFAECDGDYYYTGETVNGVIKGTSNKSFGLPSVATQPTVVQDNSGSLTKGAYLVACTFLDANGLESGTTYPIKVTTTADGKILSLSNIPVSASADVTHVAIYVSSRNGTELYRQKTVTNGTTTTTISAVTEGKYPLQTIGFSPAPTGSIIAYHWSHLYIADGEYLYYSKKYLYHLWRPQSHYKYPSNITAIMPCESGLWITTEDGIYWISGRNPKHGREAPGDFINSKKHDAVIAKGSAQKLPAEYLSTDSYGWIATSDQGIFILTDNGQFVNVSSNNIDMPKFDSCCGAIVKKGDVLNYLGIITGSSVPARTI